MTRTRDLNAKADQFAVWAARAKARTLRNAYLSLEKTCRALAAAEKRRNLTEPSPISTDGRPSMT